MNAYWYFIKWGFKPRLNKVKASGGCHRFQKKFIERSSIKSGRKYAKVHLISSGCPSCIYFCIWNVKGGDTLGKRFFEINKVKAGI
ncbi:hypothetical protein J6TS1_08440 [Siminovitchia terrae]|uniref:Uncharacterized protein n=1 Tax=Siminovitchia terrae TaxID=1914933 RepID=A0A429X378_SIMTE|nr:hypothetical protein [Siminovitchia terrae]RST57822.1 hypothetical protein D5F11_020915 [Siminovitchia terrae]GIN94974.1 hypothetical protein J6TS1_08440 [Siminovitchia terrae]